MKWVSAIVIGLLFVGFAHAEEVQSSAAPSPAAPSTEAVAQPATATPLAAPPAPSSSTIILDFKKLEWFGDLRYRFVKKHEAVDGERPIQQLRARLGLKAEVNEDVRVIFRLMTENKAISGNQTMGDSNDPGMARRSFGLDWAYLEWQFTKFGKVWGGRTANPFWSPAKTEIVYDADLAFEGIAVKLEPQWERFGAFLNLGGFMISENYNAVTGEDVVDTGLLGGQIGVIWKSKDWSWTTHFGNYYYLNIQDKPITKTLDKNASLDVYSTPYPRYLGNTVRAEDPTANPKVYLYENKYVLLEVGTEWKHKIGQIEYFIFGDAVRNDAIVGSNGASEFGGGVKYWRLTLSFTETIKGPDSVVGAFTDSDTNGGGTDNTGNRIKLTGQLAKNAILSLTYYKANRGVDTVTRPFVATFMDAMVNF